jgi:hypothetical protein
MRSLRGFRAGILLAAMGMAAGGAVRAQEADLTLSERVLRLSPFAAPDAADVTGLPPAPRCYRKERVEAKYEYSQRLVRKARLVHDEGPDGQIVLRYFPAIYIEEKALIAPEYVLLKEVDCTRRILRKADRLPETACVEARGCQELEPGEAPIP